MFGDLHFFSSIFLLAFFARIFFCFFLTRAPIGSTFLLTSGVGLCRFNTLKGTWTFSQGFSPDFDPFQAPTRIFAHFPPQGSRKRVKMCENASWGLKRVENGREALREGPSTLQAIETTQVEP